MSDLGDVGGKATDPIRTAEMTGRAMPGEIDSEDTSTCGQLLGESSPLCAIPTNAMNEHTAGVPSPRCRKPHGGGVIRSCGGHAAFYRRARAIGPVSVRSRYRLSGAAASMFPPVRRRGS